MDALVGKGLKILWPSDELLLFYQACQALGGRRWDLLEERSVVGLLHLLTELGLPGERGLNLDRPPTELTTPEGVRFLAKLVETISQEIQVDPPAEALLGTGWTHERRIHWLARLGEFYEMLRRSADEGVVPPYPVLLSNEDAIECHLYVILAYLDDITEMPGTSRTDRLGVINAVIDYLRKTGLASRKPDLLSRLHQERDRLEKAG
ncbi:MAG TPA: hypothetical protein VGO93_08755 [Candidatus Xenobia bacterium]